MQVFPHSPITTVFLAAPYGARGGGMGRIMTYLLSHGPQALPGYRFTAIETRGDASPWLAPAYLAQGLAQIAHAAAPAILHVNVAEGASLWRKGLLLAAARRRGLSCVLHLHAAELAADFPHMPPAAQARLRRIFAMAGRVIVLGEAAAAFVHESLAVKPHAISIIPNGVPDLAAIGGPRARRGGQAAELLFVGNLLPRKGLHVLIEALALCGARADSARLTVLGGGNAQAVREEAQRWGVDGRIDLLGWQGREAVTAAMLRADALILPSFHEALPLVVLEAMSAGLPVIASDVGMLGEYVRATPSPCGVPAAWLLPPGDAHALACAITTLLNQAGRAGAMAAAGRRLYQRHFTLPGFVQAVGNVYAELLADTAAANAA